MKWTYKKAPGFYKDLVSVFAVNYNRQHLDGFCYIPAKKIQDLEFCDEVISTFGPFPKELYPFFYVAEGQPCFLSGMYMNALDDIKTLTTAQMLSWLDDEQALLNKVLQYYFDGKHVAAEMTLPEVSRLIAKSEYPDDLKHQLLSLFVAPADYVKLYQREVAAKEKQLKRYYEDHEDELAQAQEAFDAEAAEKFLADKEISPCAAEFKKLQQAGQVCYTVELINRNDIDVLVGSELVSLGQHYSAAMNELRARAKAPDMVLFGKALAETNRVQILDLLLERGEMTRAQIAAEMKISENLIYYHLAMLSAASVISSYNQKRTMYYYLNGEEVERVRQALTKYIPS